MLLVPEGLGVFIELVNFSFFSISGWDIDSDYCDAEWITVILETLPNIYDHTHTGLLKHNVII